MPVPGLSHLGNGLLGSAECVGQLQGWGWSWLQGKVAFSVVFSQSIYRAVKVTRRQSDARRQSQIDAQQSCMSYVSAGQCSKF